MRAGLLCFMFLAFVACSVQAQDVVDNCLDSFNVKHRVNESYIGPDGCNTCRCRTFGNVCTRKLCDPVPKQKSEANKCVDNLGNLHELNEQYTHVDGCNTCVCKQYGGACTRRFCFKSTQISRVSSVCIDADGNGRQTGDSWTAADGCNTCRCGAIGPVCTRKGCASMMPAADSEMGKHHRQAGNHPEIADETGDSPCVVDGKTKFPGDSWLTDDSCNICRCTGMDGKVDCTEESCRARFMRLVDPQQVYSMDDNNSATPAFMSTTLMILAVSMFTIV